jgi:DNA-binding CsgD family transcriptional regulator
MPRARTIDHDRVRKLRAEGMIVRQIAIQVGASVSRVSGILRQQGTAAKPPGPQRKLLTDVSKILQLRAAGFALAAIAKRYNVAPATVRSVLREIGDPKSGSEAD